VSLVSEFKTFAMRGNVVDLAVGVVIGVAFGNVVTALVNGLIMPPIGVIIGGVNFSDFAITLKNGSEGVEPVLLQYGAFLQSIVDFTIIALAIFMVIKVMNSMKRKEEAAPEVPAPPSEEVKLLTEIRDALKSRT
jgi:large conductance mechanosensitive channel